MAGGDYRRPWVYEGRERETWAVTNGPETLCVPPLLPKVGCTSTMTGGGVAGRTLTPEWSVAGKLAAVLTSLGAGGDYTLTELVHWTGLPMSTAHRLAHQLLGRELLQKTAVGGFSAGPVLQRLTTPTPPPPRSERGPYVVEDLADTLHRRVRLGVRHNMKVAYIQKSPGHLPATSFSDAAQLPVHATALGKVLLAFAPPTSFGWRSARGCRPTPHGPSTAPTASNGRCIRSVASAMPPTWASCTRTAGRLPSRSWTSITASSPRSRPRLTTSHPTRSPVSFRR